MDFKLPHISTPSVRGGTPAHVRQARFKRLLRQVGGKRISVNLPPQAVADIERIKLRCELTTSADAITAALHYFANKSKRLA